MLLKILPAKLTVCLVVPSHRREDWARPPLRLQVPLTLLLAAISEVRFSFAETPLPSESSVFRRLWEYRRHTHKRLESKTRPDGSPHLSLCGKQRGYGNRPLPRGEGLGAGSLWRLRQIFNFVEAAISEAPLSFAETPPSESSGQTTLEHCGTSHERYESKIQTDGQSAPELMRQQRGYWYLPLPRERLERRCRVYIKADNASVIPRPLKAASATKPKWQTAS